MGQFVSVAKLSELRDGECRVVVAANQEIALFNVAGRVCAVTNVCPHRGGPIGDGVLDGRVVACPWHGWEFDVTTGKMPVNANIGIQTFPVRVDGDTVDVDV